MGIIPLWKCRRAFYLSVTFFCEVSMTSSPVGKGTVYRVQNILLWQWIKGTVALDENSLHVELYIIAELALFTAGGVIFVFYKLPKSWRSHKHFPRTNHSNSFSKYVVLGHPLRKYALRKKPHLLLVGANPGGSRSAMRIPKDNQPWRGPGNGRIIQFYW
jgi:hypothetical protein